MHLSGKPHVRDNESELIARMYDLLIAEKSVGYRIGDDRQTLSSAKSLLSGKANHMFLEGEDGIVVRERSSRR